MIIIGDCHGEFVRYNNLISKFPNETTIQVGDFGLGFPNKQFPKFGNDDWFIRGNHDNSAACQNYSQYLGDYGIRIVDGKTVFFVSGAWSIDWKFRKEGVTWWRDEELNIADLNNAIDLFTITRPDIMITHDCPESIGKELMLGQGMHEVYRTRTGQALQAMFENFQPEYWCFGHYHITWSINKNGTLFRCLPELNYVQI